MYKYYRFTNDFMFSYVLNKHSDLARELIEVILGIEVEKVENSQAQKTLNYLPDYKSVKLDVYLKNSDEIFDVEMQTNNRHDIPKRMRYYQAANTIDDLPKGQSYNELKDCYIIFICMFDPFDKGDAIYRFEMLNEKHEDLDYHEGAYNIIVNVKSKQLDISENLKNLLQYLKSEEVSDDLTEKLHKTVLDTNNDEDWRRWAMTVEQRMNEEFNLGHSVGYDEGIYFSMLSTVNSLILDGVVGNEEEACHFLHYDYQDYLKGKEVLATSKKKDVI